jgi:tripartite tricarboxylate transporter TctB family protein
MHNRASLALALAILLASAAAIVAALDWPLKSKLFPLAVGIPLFCLAAVEVFYSLRKSDGTLVAELAAEVPPELARRRTLLAAGWIAGFFVAIVLFGFLFAVPAFVLLYLRMQGRESWLFSAIFAAAVWASFYGLFDQLLHMPLPPGWILDWLGLT